VQCSRVAFESVIAIKRARYQCSSYCYFEEAKHCAWSWVLRVLNACWMLCFCSRRFR
jgi:hypothetical protein